MFERGIAKSVFIDNEGGIYGGVKCPRHTRMILPFIQSNNINSSRKPSTNVPYPTKMAKRRPRISRLIPGRLISCFANVTKSVCEVADGCGLPVEYCSSCISITGKARFLSGLLQVGRNQNGSVVATVSQTLSPVL